MHWGTGWLVGVSATHPLRKAVIESPLGVDMAQPPSKALSCSHLRLGKLIFLNGKIIKCTFWDYPQGFLVRRATNGAKCCLKGAATKARRGERPHPRHLTVNVFGLFDGRMTVQVLQRYMAVLQGTERVCGQPGPTAQLVFKKVFKTANK